MFMIFKITTLLLLLATHRENIFGGLTAFGNKILNGDTIGIKNVFSVTCADVSMLPPVFQKGYVMVYQREVPGSIVLLDVKGNIVWAYESADVGFKVVRFTKDHNFLCITGTKENESGYGNAILELSLRGDTLLYLKKGQGEFQEMIHHEIMPNSMNQVVTLCREQRVFNLVSKGGSAKDTVNGDGILVLDRRGRRIWKWTVFDALDPLLDDNILKN
jgi:hypothetical protein